LITTCNPGRHLAVEGSFEIRSVLTGEPEVNAIVKDRESSRTVTLAGLLRSLMYDPDETVTGPIRITIEPAAAAAVTAGAGGVLASALVRESAARQTALRELNKAAAVLQDADGVGFESQAHVDEVAEHLHNAINALTAVRG
jgi:hypothetical protein